MSKRYHLHTLLISFGCIMGYYLREGNYLKRDCNNCKIVFGCYNPQNLIYINILQNKGVYLNDFDFAQLEKELLQTGDLIIG